MIEIIKNLYQFSIYIPPMDFTIHQYLLANDPAILFAAGTVQQVESILPDIREILGDKPLKYVFVSHMESDEAGGVFELLKAYPDLTVICGNLAARELPGYGYTGKIKAVSAQKTLTDGALDLQFVDYPAEVHGQNGVLCFDKKSGIFYSADLFLRFGNALGKTIDSAWKDEITAIDAARVPEAGQRKKLQDALLKITPEFVAVGHGFCVKCK
ncbi:MBL fold metallo-hydrolase [uncultured Pseudoramibacter sp.]|jgi:flavorubredoxin|uniref:MBL fold metallo-hydrolase n=1 Tax=uncultured Pseudoramibacter sp. TaxID=1623493 RepID=UPI0025DB5D89|nr:MBL fold metallo-hydrolase [uncultured Pseudoramibacter sp.]